jgi:stage II sporulation protein D
MTRARSAIVGGLALVVAVALAPPGAGARSWLIKGHGWGHGVGMSSWGSYGFARHGRTYGQMMAHYYQGTHLGHVKGKTVRVLLSAGTGSVTFSSATSACGRSLTPSRSYRFVAAGSSVALADAAGRQIASCGHSASAAGGPIRVAGQGVYRGRLVARGGGGIQLVNRVGLEGYTMGVVPNEAIPSWPQPALRAEAVAARTFGLAAKHRGSFDVYDDTRSQVYEGKSSEMAATNRAVRASAGKIVKYHQQVATTYYSSSSGGHTESLQFAFIGAHPIPYLRGVPDPYDGASPLHTWSMGRLSQASLSSKLSGMFSGRLQRIRVLKHGTSPRIVYARVVGSRSSSRVTGPELESRLGAYSTWIHFKPVAAKAAPHTPAPSPLPAGTAGPQPSG